MTIAAPDQRAFALRERVEGFLAAQHRNVAQQIPLAARLVGRFDFGTTFVSATAFARDACARSSGGAVSVVRSG